MNHVCVGCCGNASIEGPGSPVRLRCQCFQYFKMDSGQENSDLMTVDIRLKWGTAAPHFRLFLVDEIVLVCIKMI